jgi:hypothetical protein
MSTREVEHLGSLRYLPLLGEADQLSGYNALKTAYEGVMEMDKTIFRFAQALEMVQPPAPGKISIRFLKRRSGETDSRHPTFIQWFQGNSGRWLYNRLKPADVLRRQKSYSAFLLTKEDAREILIQARHLVELRESLQKDIGNMKRTLAMHSAKARIASDPYRELIEKRLPEIQAKRAEIILDVRDAKKFAIQELPEEAMADTQTMPKTHPKGRTRGTRTLTHARTTDAKR